MKVREAARAIVCDGDRNILLIKIVDHSAFDLEQPKKAAFWVTPGGGLESGESYRQALGRELKEELGLDKAIVGPCLWRGQVYLIWQGTPTTICGRYFYVAAPAHKN